jgi:hypothetical protein
MYARWAENLKREERGVTSAMMLGAVSHHLLLGEENFRSTYIAQPETYRDKTTAVEKPWNNNALACKFWNEKQKAAGRTVVKVDQLDAVVAMSRSLALEPLVHEGLLRGHVECSGFAQDAETGLWLKTRPDVIPTMTGDFVDLKTAADVTSVALMSSIRTYGYHQQGALIWEVTDQLGADHPFEGFVLMFVETANPWCARTVPLTKDDLVRGRKQNRAMLRTITRCINEDHWPGPGEGDLRELPLGHDERVRIDERLKHEGVP